MTLDIIIPCYNCETTLFRTIESALKQTNCKYIWLVNDASTDGTQKIINKYVQKYPNKIKNINIPKNVGVAAARNLGAWSSKADIVAFIDSDDEYLDNALEAAHLSLESLPYLGLVRLNLKPVNLPGRYSNHPKFNNAWRRLEMTVGGNTVFRRSFFLACGGFPEDDLFREFGGEDGALGIAIFNSSLVGTLFNDSQSTVLHYWRDGIHAERLLNAELFSIHDDRITEKEQNMANEILKK